ncbi:hypothetical protein Patl1_23930 [Pistacia atlantica]|uniref:Uncharacterized protein n=1 Tax=Pistacia atlantica TaxID=434234 RepID=A0ACC1A1T6_9ROSI|nr:hypothetical protein Patl1_23930 [Pistacia atlantica]
MRSGVSGEEITVGPMNTLFMDEITYGLDISTTFQIVACLQLLVHITDATIVGKIVYHGPRESVLEFFEGCGFRCPERKAIADFLQELSAYLEEKPRTTKKGSTKGSAPSAISRMVLPFEPLAITFQDVNYYVETPVAMKKRGFAQKRLQLLRNITGTFRPDVLTALMGVSGAGKTILLDVLAGRKTNGYIEGITKSMQSSLSIPPPDSGDLHFPTSFAQSGWGQFKSSLWKQNLSYWRSPPYNMMHLLQTFFASLLFGAMYWNQGQEL